jgi:TPR repeat protein
MSKRCLSGSGVNRNIDLFLEPLQKSVEANQLVASFDYGFVLFTVMIMPNKQKEAVLYFQKFANLQEAEECFGLCLNEGIGIQRDHRKGLKMIGASLNLGYFPSDLYLTAIPSSHYSIKYQ